MLAWGLNSCFDDGHGEDSEQKGNMKVGRYGSFYYFEDEANALNDASMHVDSVLRLNSSLLDGQSGKYFKKSVYTNQHAALTDDNLADGIGMVSPRASPDCSTHDIKFSIIFLAPGRQADGLLERVTAQDPKAMEQLATHLLEDKEPFSCDRDRVISSMELAIARERKWTRYVENGAAKAMVMTRWWEWENQSNTPAPMHASVKIKNFNTFFMNFIKIENIYNKIENN